jgi:hypothetical protein
MLKFVLGGLKASSVSWKSINGGKASESKACNLNSNFEFFLNWNFISFYHQKPTSTRAQNSVADPDPNDPYVLGLPGPHPDPLDIDVLKVTDENSRIWIRIRIHNKSSSLPWNEKEDLDGLVVSAPRHEFLRHVGHEVWIHGSGSGSIPKFHGSAQKEGKKT